MTWEHLFVKVHGSVHLKYEHSSGGKLYLNEVGLKIKRDFWNVYQEVTKLVRTLVETGSRTLN